MKHQVNALTSTRAAAAILVVIHHFGYDVYPFNRHFKFFHNGNVAVSYFFVLSGFVLYISYKDAQIRYPDYLKRRIARIAPIYYLALFLFIAIAHHFLDYHLRSAQSVKEIVLSGLFLQSYVPTYPLCLNSPSWTLSVEMLFYLLFPFFLSFQKKRLIPFIVVTAVLFIASQIVHLWCFQNRFTLNLDDNVTDTLFFNPVIHISQFMIGMIGGYLFGKVAIGAPKYGWFSLGSFIAIFLLIAFRPQSISYQVGLIAPVFMIFILCLAASNPKFLNLKPLVFLGEVSYGIYILQFPVYKFLKPVNLKYLHIPPDYFFYVALAILILTASLSYMFFEKPLRNKINAIRIGG